MARKVLVRLVDDLDGLPSEDVATVTFSLDRVTYQIDLNESNAGKLRDGLAGFIGAARRTGGRIKRGAAVSRGAGAGNDGPAIREWARENGHQLAERGRIPSHIVDEFRAATRGGKKAEPVTATVTKARTRRAPATAAPAKTAAASRSAAKATATAKPATRTRNTAAKTAAKTTKTAAKATEKKTTAAKSTAKTTAKTTPRATARRTATKSR